MQGMDLERNQQQPPAGRCRRRRGGMQRAHSAIREHSDHLITFQSGLPHAAHQPLQDKTPPGARCEGGLQGSCLPQLTFACLLTPRSPAECFNPGLRVLSCKMGQGLPQIRVRVWSHKAMRRGSGDST